MNVDILSKIEDLLRLSGVHDPDLIEEMMDHYLCEIESSVASGIPFPQAIRNTYRTIAESDLSKINNGRKANQKRVMSVLISLFLIISLIVTKNLYFSPCKAPSSWPIDTSKPQVTSDFGPRIHPFSKAKKFHRGIDIKASYGTSVIAPEKGMVLETGYNSAAGNYLIVRHNKEFSTRYNHLSDIIVSKNEYVSKGDEIAKVGSSGLSTFPHLHYEIMKNDEIIDPIGIIRP